VEIETQFGLSLWLIETRIGLEQYFIGLEAQKEYTSKIKAQYQSGLPPYIAHHCSVRNEPRSTLHRCNNDAISRIEKAAVRQDTKTYLRYRVVDEFSGTERDASALLRIEQAQSIIDLYETAIDIIQKLTITGKLSRYKNSVLTALGAWSEIDDYRIAKLLAVIGKIEPSSPSLRNSATLEHLLTSSVSAGYRLALKSLQALPTDAWSAIEAAVCLSLRGRTRSSHGKTPWAVVVERLSILLSRGEHFEQASADLQKFLRNFQTLPTAKAMLDFVRHITVSQVERPTHLSAPCLNSALWGSEDLRIATGQANLLLKDLLRRQGHQAASCLWDDSAPGHDWSEAARAAQTYIVGRTRPRDGAVPPQLADKALNLNLPSSIRAMLSSLAIDWAVADQDLDAAVTLIAAEAVLSPVARANLPVALAVGGRTWEELGRVNDKLALAIVLDLLLRRTNDDTVATFLRFAFEEHLTTLGLSRPSDIASPENAVDKLKAIYFLRYVCVPSTMEMFGAFAGSRDLEEERILICERLAEFDPARNGEYEAELRTLKNRLLIQDGIKLVDSSRIHVDVGPISRLAEQSLGESFSRYRALIDAGIGLAKDLDTVMTAVTGLRSTAKGAERGSEYLEVPENEADTTLLEIILTLRDQFLNDSNHGLNFYLSKRIRHGTIAGYLRSPIEESSLITQRESETAPYRPNEYWLSRLSFTSSSARAGAAEAFERFAKEIDGWIRELKDDYLQIRNKEHPKGLFEIVVTAPTYHVIRSAIQQDLTFQAFLESCFAIFWAFLEPSLAAARSLLVVHTKDKFALAFAGLHEAIRGYAEQDESFRSFGTAIRTTSAEIQRQIDMMSDWLRRTEVQQVTHRFTIEEVVDIAVESALKAHKSFRPNITKEIFGGDLDVTASILVILSDILFILFDNIFKYAKSGNEPRVLLRIEADRTAEVIRIFVVNETGRTVRTDEVEAELSRIRQNIDNRTFAGRVQREGKSGFFKIANIVYESKRGELGFGFLENGDFAVRVTVPVIAHSPGPGVSSDEENVNADFIS